jgi:SAM-dependent methyltransferase
LRSEGRPDDSTASGGAAPGPASGPAPIDGLADRIAAAAAGSSFDFRPFGCPDDPDAHLFDEWVARYRRKWALARVLEPNRIIEIGGGYGYAAAAFLSARPEAHYLGIDTGPDAGSEGGASAAWAARSLEGFDVSFATVVPSQTFDMAHVGGTPDGDLLFEAIDRVLARARYVVIDGYSIRSRFLAANEAVYQHRDDIASCWTFPRHGELVIAVGREAPEHRSDSDAGTAPTSGALRHHYDEHYFLQDCGGHEGYKQTKGARLRDPRLAAVASIGGLRDPRRVLDLGCGRGELTFHFAKTGARVTAVDYSPEAVELAERCFAEAPDLRAQVNLVVGDVGSVALDGPYDVAVASDLVEHLTPAELDVLYGRVAVNLAADGVLVVHTYPNRWFYEREYPRRRAQAAALGAYLPPEPRTRYEQLLHINEQSPDDLAQQLAKHFSSVVVWSGEPADLGRTLRPDQAGTLEVAPGLYALASQDVVDGEALLRAMAMTPLSDDDVGRLSLRVAACPNRVPPGQTFEAQVELTNRSTRALRSNGPNPFHLTYRWLDKGGDGPVTDGRRSLVFPWLGPGMSDEYDVTVDAPEQPGDYLLRLTAVQEFVAWFDDPAGGLAQDVAVAVSADAAGSRGPR